MRAGGVLTVLLVSGTVWLVPGCKVIGLPFRVAGAVVGEGTAAWEDAAEKRRVKRERKKAREAAAEKKAAQEAAKPTTAPQEVPPLPADATGVLPPLPQEGGYPEMLPPLEE